MRNSSRVLQEKFFKNLKLIVIAALIVVVIAVFIGSNRRNEISFKIDDKCGKFVNLMSHTIGDDGICKSRCRSQCTSMGKEYIKAEFKKIDSGCNSCACYCR